MKRIVQPRRAATLHLGCPLRNVRLVSTSDPSGTPKRDELAAAEAEGYRRGVIDGEKNLGEQLIRQRAELLALHNGAVEALRNAVPHVVAQTETSLIELAYQIAQKLVGELPITPGMIAACVREALAEVEPASEHTVCLHPDDLALLNKHTTAANESTGPTDSPACSATESIQKFNHSTNPKVSFKPSTELTRGGCVVHTRFGIIDALRETKLARIAGALGLSPSASPACAATAVI